MNETLYGIKKPPKLKGKPISSSTAQSFSSTLSSLISSNTSKAPNKSKSVASKGKDDLFTAHNKNVKKRAAKDLEDEGTGQVHRTKDDIGHVSAADLHRSKRRMEEKVRLYNAMKRGEYVGRDNGYDDRGLVDFDRKWAEKEVTQEQSDESDDNSDDSDPSNDEVVEWIDEFGRLRKSSKKEAEREEREARIQAIARDDAQQFAAHPQAPTNVIYGDAIQHQAFNPERTIAEQMAELAKKRDKSATPPPDTHFDATAEVRTKGTAFYTFSHDKADREREMADLEKTRAETEKIRKERAEQSSNPAPETEAKSEGQERAPGPEDKEDTAKSDAQRFMDDFELPPD